MRAVTHWMLGTALAVCSASAFGQTAEPPPTGLPGNAQAQVIFQFEHPGLAVPQFTLRVNEDGSGRYEADQAEIPATANEMRGQAAQHIDHPIQLSPGLVAKIFKDARALNHFNIVCASKAKNIADTGKKTLSYAGADGSGTCTYNYSENKTVEILTGRFLAIAFTMDEGRRLEFLHRYDRLGLDAEMIYFTEEIEAGRALELGTIAPALASIADDNALIQRVRLKAQKMLEQVAADNH
jgi:hypothetical protein